MQPPLEQTNNTMPFVVGPTVDIRLYHGLSLSTGLLFTRTGQRVDNASLLFPENAVTFVHRSVRGRAIELPLLAKYRFPASRRAWQPFLSIGGTVRRTSIESLTLVSSTAVPNPFIGSSSIEGRDVRWNLDPTAGVGVDVRAGRFHLEPEVRYSYWGAGKHSALLKNQVNFLLGLRF